MTFVIGQRWISSTESHLGLGIITEVQGRTVNIHFPAAEEERIYAINNAPLSRIIYQEGDEITTNEKAKLTITAVNEYQGLMLYSGLNQDGSEAHITEISLDCFVQLNTPQQRLFSGLTDKLDTFKLRIATLTHLSQLQQSKVSGLLGARTNHLPHQVYIAHEVAKRYAPRVLLADEVGLGKTIEAGMITHYQLHTGRAQRVLVIVPETLIHQWLVEMIRRFNLHFSIIDQNRYDSIQDNDWDEENAGQMLITPDQKEMNPFAMEPLALCSLDFLLWNEEAYQHIISTNWDLLIVDEAHHLQWSEQEASPEYLFIEQIAKKSKGLLLLTATPEQAGIDSHFARLRLLDPARFYDLTAFKNEEHQYQKVNQLIQTLMEAESVLDQKSQKQLEDYLGHDIAPSREENIKLLLDRHGTGRVLFRNTRLAIQGFPKREVQSYPLPCPTLYQNSSEPLYPEHGKTPHEWIEQDPRVTWLVQHITSLHPHKILIICAKTKTAIALDQYLKIKVGIRSSLFHEGLSIIERDKAAAYFADIEQGAPILICSEIGSEGRNFQFAHHLILFDLPLNPDLLEQRIGRLDRIGQKNTIQIHVPYLSHSAQEILFRWYHEGINLFNQSCSVGFSIYKQFEQQLLALLKNNTSYSIAELEHLLTATQEYTAAINEALHAGRDRLLEMSSCNQIIAKALIAEIEAEENILELENYMAAVFQEYGLDQEDHSEQTEILRPSDHMKISHFPYVEEDGTTVTYSRAKALAREDIVFLSWEHPMVHEIMEMIQDSELGNATVTAISLKSIPLGTVFLEVFYTINCAAPKILQLDRYLPLIPIRLFMDASGKNLSKIMDYNQLNTICQPMKQQLSHSIIKQLREPITFILDQCKPLAEQELQVMTKYANDIMTTEKGQELNRLIALQRVNPTIRNEEIHFLERQISEAQHYINNATLKMQALRVVVNK